MQGRPHGILDLVSVIFAESLAIYLRGFGLFFGLWSLCLLPLNILQVVFFPSIAIPVNRGTVVNITSLDQTIAMVNDLVTLLVTLGLTLATVVAVEEVKRGRFPRLSQIYLAALRRYLPALLTSVPFILLFLPGLALLVGGMAVPNGLGLAAVGAGLLLLALVFTVPAMALLPPVIWNEGRWWWRGTRRILEILRRRWALAWLVLLAGFILLLAAYSAGMTLIVVLTGLFTGGNPVSPLSSRSGLASFAVLGTLLGVLVQPFWSILGAVLYHNLVNAAQATEPPPDGNEAG